MRAWTTDERETVMAMWNSKKFSAAIIARQYGVTRNSIIGLVDRIRKSGTTMRRTPPRVKSERRASRRKEQGIEYVTDAEKRRRMANKPSATPTQLIDLNASTCRWPIGDPGDDGFHFCGSFCNPVKTYCETHERIAYEAKRNQRVRLPKFGNWR